MIPCFLPLFIGRRGDKRMTRFLSLFLTAALGVLSAVTVQGSELLTLSGQILPGGIEFPAVKPDGAAERPIAWLVLHGEMPGRHIYSLTQPKVPGGYPTKVSVSFSDKKEISLFTVGSFIAATPIERVDFMGNTLEEWNNNFDLIAPVYLYAGSESEQFSPETAVQKLTELAPSGEIDALCCGGSNCVPVKESIRFTPGDGTIKLEQLLETALQVQEGESETSSQLSVSEIEEIDLFAEEENADSNTAAKDSDLSAVAPSAEKPESASEISGNTFLLRNLLYAFFGGMILNIMPCVLPVIGLKIVSFFEQAGNSRSRAFWLNLCYSAGILTVFTVLALMSVGLSYLFTYGLFQIVMGTIVFAMALNLMGVWEITLPAFLGGETSNKLSARNGSLGSWTKGVITTLLAIPCGAPLLSPALVWTDSLIKSGSIWQVLLIYWLIGLGMAAPFLILGAFPELLKFLPKPGMWMETFKNVMGFVLLAAVIWILYSMPLPLILPMITFLFAVWFACWYVGKDQFDPDRKPLKIWMTALAVLVLTALFSFEIPAVERTSAIPNLERAFRGKLIKWGIRAERNGDLTQSDWQLFDQTRFDQELASGKTVMVDFTADWCMNCKVLEAAVLRSTEIADLIEEKGIVTMTGDWTNRDDSEESRDVGNLLRRYGGEQVPVVMIFTPKNPESPIVFRGLFTKSELAEKLKEL